MSTSRGSKSKNIEIGNFGEQFIANFIVTNGGRILDRNWRVKEGEIDIVALDPSGVIAFVEVKTRSSLAFGHPLEAISRQKAFRLQRLALAWLATHESLGKDYRIDCAAVLLDSEGNPSFDYRANVL